VQPESGVSPRSPYLPDVGVIGLVPNVWGRGNWQPRHQVLTRLSSYFNVVWCNPAPSWRKLWHSNTVGKQEIDSAPPAMSGLTIYDPERWLPAIGRPRIFANWTTQQRLRRAMQKLHARGCTATILYLWRPQFARALDLIRHDISCYHIDDEYTFSPVEKPLGREEAGLISRVDQVFIHSPALLEKKGHLNPKTLLVPNGVDFRSFSTPVIEPVDMHSIPHPRIGYVGIIKNQLDIPLLVTLARRHRNWSFVFVGPENSLGTYENLIRELKSRPNVYFLGRKSVQDLPGYVQHMDVCMLCYKVDDYTNFIYPLKLHEYLASGRPVVGSPIRSLMEFSDVVRLARTPEEWSRALSESLAKDAMAPAQIQLRRAIARKHDWDRLVGSIARTLCDRLGPSYVERIEKILTRSSVAPPVMADIRATVY